MERTGIDPVAIKDVIMGCVTQAGEQATQVGRNAVLASRLPDSIPAVTIDRKCGSSQQAVQFAAQAVMSGTQDVVIAASVESMSRVLMNMNASLPTKSGIGTGPYSQAIYDRYGTRDISQFTGAELIAEKHGLTKQAMDAFALESHRKAKAVVESGAFTQEILSLTGCDSEGMQLSMIGMKVSA